MLTENERINGISGVSDERKPLIARALRAAAYACTAWTCDINTTCSDFYYDKTGIG